MIATIANNQDIFLSNITPWEEEILDKHFSAERPNTRRYLDSEQSWDGVIRRYNRSKKRLARPFLAALKLLCRNKGLSLSINDIRQPVDYEIASPEEITENYLPGIVLKSYQVEAIKKVCSTETGVFSISTGGGKTELMCGIAKAVKCHTVMIAEQTVIIDQIVSRLKSREVASEPGVFYAGRKPDGELIIVGTIQSLVSPKKTPDIPEQKNYRKKEYYTRAVREYEKRLKAYHTRKKNSKVLHKLIAKCDMILVDEADLAVSDTYKQLFRHWFKGRRRYGFTGTPFDASKPVEALILQEHLGSVIYKQDRHEVLKAGLTVPLIYIMIVIGTRETANDSRAFDIAIDEDIVHNDRFHKIIAAICHKYKDFGSLVLVGRDSLGHSLNDLIPKSKFYHGKTKMADRSKILRDFESRELRVLIGGKNVRRGLDLNGGAENLIIATGGKLASEFDQQLGRARRLNSSGIAKVHDFLFLTNKYLYDHSRKRLKAAVDMGYQCYVVYPDGVIDGASFINSRFRRPRVLPMKTIPDIS